MVTDFNVHVRCSEQEYRRIVAHAKQLGMEPKVQKGTTREVLFVTLPVTLYVSPNDGRKYKTVGIHDRTYSREVFRCEEVYKDGIR